MDSQKDMYADAFLEEEDEVLSNDKYLLFNLGEEVYGINIHCITDIIEFQEITKVPDMPAFVKGVINLRGSVVPVTDLRLRFGMEERQYDKRTCIVIVNIEEIAMGFIVDTVVEVHEIPKTDVDPAPDFKCKSGEGGKYIAGLGKIGDQVKILLDVDKLLSRDDLEAVREGTN